MTHTFPIADQVMEKELWRYTCVPAPANSVGKG